MVGSLHETFSGLKDSFYKAREMGDEVACQSCLGQIPSVCWADPILRDEIETMLAVQTLSRPVSAKESAFYDAINKRNP